MYGGKQNDIKEPTQSTRISDVYNDVRSDTHFDKSHSFDNDVTGGIFSILAPEPENHPKEEMPLPRRRKKKKRRYGRQM